MADESYMHLQVRLHYGDYERLKRVLKLDLKMSAQAFLIEAISAKLQELGHEPIRDPGTARPKKGA
ncbi:MAG: hypothetical protein FD176_155 [Rhodospirillaceae bacterium]|nr:MAG: hypothetical protein FD176_155 [Rhodospirillaceae bacterium]TNC98673.1 MAG: hypothetical protein FD119_144 [Stygiobacter sp.]